MAISKIIYKENAEATPVVWMDTTDKTADSGNMLNGITALKNDGTTATGSIQSQAAQTIYPSTSDQTIASGKYLTGTQTFAGVLLTNLSAGNIKKDVVVKVGDSVDDDRITSVTGTYEGGTTPTGIKYLYSDIEGEGAWDVSNWNYEYCSYDYAPIRDNHMRLWVNYDAAATFTIKFLFSRVSGSVQIDWGDGTSKQTVSSSAFTENVTHDFSTAGRFPIDIAFISGTVGIYSIPNATKNVLVGIEYYTINGSSDFSFGATTSADAAYKLKKVYVADDSVNNGTYRNCTSLKQVHLSEVATAIGAYCFGYCTSLETIIIPACVTTIYNAAFAENPNLKEVHMLPTIPPTLSGSDWFYHSTNCTIYVPQGTLSTYQSASNWSLYASQMAEEPA